MEAQAGIYGEICVIIKKNRYYKHILGISHYQDYH